MESLVSCIAGFAKECCGVPHLFPQCFVLSTGYENAPVTTLLAGSTIEISYHLAYAHRVSCLYIVAKMQSVLPELEWNLQCMQDRNYDES